MRVTFYFAIFSIAILFVACDPPVSATETEYVYRFDMRELVKNIAQSARAARPNFIVVPQNGQAVALRSYCSDCAASIDVDYMNSIDGIGREDLNYGYSKENTLNSASQNRELSKFLNLYEDANKAILVTDYVYSQAGVDDSYQTNKAEGYLGFAAPSRDLDEIPAYPIGPLDENSNNISSLAMAKNFLYLINPVKYSDKNAFLQAVANTNYDVVIIDAFFDGALLNSGDIESLKTKSNGAKRLVLAYMSIGEAEDYRYYWKTDWETNKPDWLLEENREWPGNYKVEYWNPDWQGIIFSNSDSYLNKIVSSGFSGVYLDVIDAYEYFEEEG